LGDLGLGLFAQWVKDHQQQDGEVKHREFAFDSEDVCCDLHPTTAGVSGCRPGHRWHEISHVLQRSGQTDCESYEPVLH